MMEKHGFLARGHHGELNLSHPRRQPLLTGQTPTGLRLSDRAAVKVTSTAGTSRECPKHSRDP